MSTDLYAKCPCGSGKKIKFCCRDIISDIERIERMLRGEQRTAALDKIDKLLGKHPDRPALLSLKAQVCFELKQIDDAKPVVERLLEVEPDNATGLAMKATLAVMGHDARLALKLVHRAMRMSDGVLSEIVYKSYMTICVHLVQVEAYLAAYAHLLTLVSITKGADGGSVSLLVKVSSSEKLPAVFLGLLISSDCRDNVTWKREFQVAFDYYRHGDWTEAAALLEDMNSRILDEPILLRNLGILQAWTLQNEKAAKTFRMYTALRGLDLDDAVEAEACAQALEPTVAEDLQDVVKVTRDIDDADAVMENLLSSDTVQSAPVGRDSSEDAPPPKGQFVLFDRPSPSDSEGVTLADLPQDYGTVTIYGRETDRNARLIAVLTKDECFIENLSRISELTGVAVDADATTEVLARVHRAVRVLRANFRVPPETTVDGYNGFLREWISSRLEQVWPTLPLAMFGGRPAAEAAKDPKYTRAVLAAILNLELWVDRQPTEFDFNRLRENLGLPPRERIDPNDVDIRSLSPSRLVMLELEKLSDEDLVFLFEVTSVRPNGRFLFRIGVEVLKRPALEEQIDFIEVHERLAELAPTTDEQLEHLRMARDIAVGRGESPAHWLVHELDVRLSRAEIDPVKRLISEIQSRYLREPGIAQFFGSVLEKYGLLPAEQQAAPASSDAAARPAAATAAPASSGVWTPDSATDGPQQTEDGEKAKIWVPGMD